MSEKIVKIGGATAFVTDSTMGLQQFLAMEDPPKYLLFDMLSEGVMPLIGRAADAGNPGYSATFPHIYVLPLLRQFLAKGMRLVANAGGVDGLRCADVIRQGAEQQGLSPKIAVIDGDDLRPRAEELAGRGLTEMFSGEPVADLIGGPRKLLSMSAYVGAFPIAEALSRGADIVIIGRAVDSAAALGPLIHEFGWGPDDFDKLAGGTLCGHLIECSAQVTGGTFTDWEEVEGWDNIGFPVAECRADGSFVLTKPDGTGGLVTPQTCAEQLIYEVSDPQAYFVPDVVCDFSDVRFRQVGEHRIDVTNAKGRARTSEYKVSFTVDQGWQASTVIPIIGRDAVKKARRTGEAFIARTRNMLRQRNLAEWSDTRVEALGGEAMYGPHASAAAQNVREVLCRIVVNHESQEGAEVLMREYSSVISHMAPGTTPAIVNAIKPLSSIGAFLLPKSEVPLTLHIDGQSIATTVATDGRIAETRAPAAPAAPDDLDGGTVPLIALAYARSGDKGNLFNIGVMARKPEYLPAIHAALTDEAVLDHYRHLALDSAKVSLERYFMPGFDGINFVVNGCMQGGMTACLMVDSGAKGMAQLLLEHPVRIPRALAHDADLLTWMEQPQPA
jgi:hypothetical protein